MKELQFIEAEKIGAIGGFSADVAKIEKYYGYEYVLGASASFDQIGESCSTLVPLSKNDSYHSNEQQYLSTLRYFLNVEAFFTKEHLTNREIKDRKVCPPRSPRSPRAHGHERHERPLEERRERRAVE